MAGKAVVSFKIGYSVTNVAEVDYEAKTPKVYHAFSFETPDGVLDDEGVHVTEEFVEQVKRGMLEAGIHNNRVIFTISSGRVANRDVTIPLVKEAKIRPLLIANSKEYFPIDITKYQLVYRVIDQDKSKKEMRLSVFAVPNTLVDSYQTMAKALGLQLVGMDYYGNSIYQAMMHSMPKELAATICIDGNSSIVTIIQDSKVVLQRSIGYGIDDAVYAMMQSSLVSSGTGYLKALEKMQMNICFNEQLRPQIVTSGESGAESMSARESITRSLTMLIGNISRVLDYFVSRHSEVDLNEIALVGLGADCQGLDRLLTNELGVNISAMRRFGSVDITRGLSAQSFHLGEYYSCIGSAIAPLNFILATEEKKEERQSLTDAIVVFVGCIVVSLILVAGGMVTNLLLETSNDELRRQIQSKQSIVDTYNNYLTLKVTDEALVVADANTDVPNDAFLEFLEEMEEKAPSDLVVSSLSVSEDTMTISASCTSKESATEALIQLRTFDTILNLSCSGISEEVNDAGATQAKFDIVLTYVGGATEALNAQTPGGQTTETDQTIEDDTAEIDAEEAN